MPTAHARLSVHPLHRSLASAWRALFEQWNTWRDARRARRTAHATARALAGLRGSTLRDIGMQGCVPPVDERASLFDAGPGRW